MIGRSLIAAIASMISWVNNFGTALTPMIAVGRNALTASTKVPIGGRSCAKGFWKSARSVRELEEPIDVEERVALPRLGDVEALPRHREADQFGDAGAGRAAAEKQEPLIGQLCSGDARGGEDTGERDPRRALDVIIVGADLVAVARQYRHGVEVRKILPLDAAFRVERLHRRDELVDKFGVFGAAHPVLAKTEIERVLEQHGVVCADIEHDRQAILRRHAGAGGVERQLPDRDAHAAGAEIAEAEDALAIGDDDKAHILF